MNDSHTEQRQAWIDSLDRKYGNTWLVIFYVAIVSMLMLLSAPAKAYGEQAMCTENNSGGLMILTFRNPVVLNDGSIGYLAISNYKQETDNFVRGVWMMVDRHTVGVLWFTRDEGDQPRVYRTSIFKRCPE